MAIIWLKLIKALEIKTSTIFNLVFANNTILSCFFLLFMIIDLYFLIAAVNTQMFNPTSKLAIPIAISANEAKAEIETQPVTKGTKVCECWM